MKKFLKVFTIGLATILFTACGGGGGDSTPPLKVNLIGTWNYQTFTQNSACDGLLAQGVKIGDSMNGDTTRLGNTLVQGTTFTLDGNQNCYLTSIDELVGSTYGLSSTITQEEYLNQLKNTSAGDNTIDSIRVDSFNNSKIQKSISYKNGIIITETLTR